MSRRNKFAILLASVCLVISTPFIFNVTVYDLSSVSFGAPFKFIVQHPTLTPPQEALPLVITMLDPRQHPSEILFDKFLLSVGVVALELSLLQFGMKGIVRLIRQQ